MKRLFLLFCYLVPIHAQAQVIPQPLDDRGHPGEYRLAREAMIAAPPQDLDFYIQTLKQAGVAVLPATADGRAGIRFSAAETRPDRYPVPAGEGYVLRITPEGIQIHAATGSGWFHGLQTLIQLIEAAPKTDDQGVRLACREISDSPRFAWRGFMLDESRHFTGPAGVKRLIDAMARFKLNRLHWHLTDSPGWRIEIKKYPELTRIGGRGCESDRRPDAPASYYTQDQIREIVAYAKQRAITIIPEIDMPGHADAAVIAYPAHDGGGFVRPKDPQKWPHFTFNPAKSATLTFLDDILMEVAALFPDAGVIHFGGDEVNFGWQEWPKLPEVQELMKKENLKDLAAVEAWFNRRMAATINRLGFKTGGWDEIAACGLATDKTLIWWWRHDKPQVLKQTLADGYNVILCPRLPCYFDFVQLPGHKAGRSEFANQLRDVYQFPAALNLSPGEEKKVLGVQACLWTETAITQARRDFVTWPRLIALAEAAWTAPDKKDFASFETRLKPQLPWLKARGIGYFDPFNPCPEITDTGVTVEYPDKLEH